jgi:hypothetical protein
MWPQKPNSAIKFEDGFYNLWAFAKRVNIDMKVINSVQQLFFFFWLQHFI